MMGSRTARPHPWQQGHSRTISKRELRKLDVLNHVLLNMIVAANPHAVPLTLDQLRGASAEEGQFAIVRILRYLADYLRLDLGGQDGLEGMALLLGVPSRSLDRVINQRFSAGAKPRLLTLEGMDKLIALLERHKFADMATWARMLRVQVWRRVTAQGGKRGTSEDYVGSAARLKDGHGQW